MERKDVYLILGIGMMGGKRKELPGVTGQTSNVIEQMRSLLKYMLLTSLVQGNMLCQVRTRTRMLGCPRETKDITVLTNKDDKRIKALSTEIAARLFSMDREETWTAA